MLTNLPHTSAIIVTKTYPSTFAIACITIIPIHRFIALLLFLLMMPYQTVMLIDPNVDSFIGTPITLIASITTQIDPTIPSYWVPFIL